MSQSFCVYFEHMQKKPERVYIGGTAGIYIVLISLAAFIWDL